MPRVNGKAAHELSAGEYGKWPERLAKHLPDDGIWYAVPPGTDLVANLASHQIKEHEDGTISVSPSIRVGDGNRSWHGYLRNGVFEEC